MAVQNRIVGYKQINVDKIVKFHGGNPRAMDDEMARMLETSISTVGFVEPIIVRMTDDGYEVLNGHHRLQAMLDAGETKIPSIIVDVDDEVQARTLALGLNRIGAEWKADELEQYIKDTQALGGELEWIADVSGMRHDELDVFKDLSTGFLEEYQDSNVSGADEGGFDGDEGIEPSDADADDAEETPVPLTFNLIPSDRKKVTQALRAVQQRETGVKKNVDALMFLCDLYMGNVGTTDEETTEDEDED